jgi:hypothetical protein
MAEILDHPAFLHFMTALCVCVDLSTNTNHPTLENTQHCQSLARVRTYPAPEADKQPAKANEKELVSSKK